MEPAMSGEGHVALLRGLHDEHAGSLGRFVLGLTHDEQLAQDVVQETLLRAWKHPEVLDRSPDSARAWLYAVARNIVIDDRRSARFRREVDADRVPECSCSDPTETALDRWLIADALAALTFDHRTVLVRAFYGGRSVTELADELDLPVSTIRSRLHFGLRALRLALQERGVISR